MPILYNRICLLMAHRLKDYQRSGVSIVSGCLHLLFLILVTTVTLTAANFALFVADKSAFDASGTPSLFTFFFYSINNFVFNFIKEVTPASALSQGLWTIGFFFALFVGLFFVSLVFTEKARRHDEELKSAVAAIEQEGFEMERFLKEHYSVMNVDDVVDELQRLKSGLAKIVLFFTQQA